MKTNDRLSEDFRYANLFKNAIGDDYDCYLGFALLSIVGKILASVVLLKQFKVEGKFENLTHF